MDNTNSLAEFRKKLRYGAVRSISDKTGIGYYTVLKVLNGDMRSPKAPDIIQAAIEYYKDREEKLKQATQQLKSCLASIDNFLDTPIAKKALSQVSHTNN